MRHKRIGTLQTIFIAMTRPWRNYFYGGLHQKNMLETRMRILSSRYADFLNLRDDIQIQSPLSVSGLRNADSENSIVELSDFHWTSLSLT